MPTREQVCSQQIHCLSCPLSVGITGKDCRELTPEEVRLLTIIDDIVDDADIIKWYMDKKGGKK